jgi:hypothetical protein
MEKRKKIIVTVFLIIFVLILSICCICCILVYTELELIPISSWGAFANINNVLTVLINNPQKFRITWNVNETGIDWDKIFYQPYGKIENYKIPIKLGLESLAVPIKNTTANKISQVVDGYMNIPSDENRRFMKTKIDKYLKLKPKIQKIVDNQIYQFDCNFKIGIHIRGVGKNDAGFQLVKKNMNLTDGLPYKNYTDILDKLIIENLNRKICIYLATDNLPTVDYFEKHYEDYKIYTYDSIKSVDNFGEMHTKVKKDKNQKIVEDVVIEAYILSNMDVLVHGVSNISNFVLCNNPKIISYYIDGI